MPNVSYTLKTFFSQLKILDLSYNKIKKIQAEQLIDACPNLTHFIIAHNQISTLDEFLPLGSMQFLQELNFQGNPLESLKKPFIVLQTLLLHGVLDHFQQNKVQILSMTETNSMKVQLTDKEFRDIQKIKDIKVPRIYGNFRNLVSLNGTSQIYPRLKKPKKKISQNMDPLELEMFNKQRQIDEQLTSNKLLIKQISNSDSKVMKRKVLYKTQLRKHQMIINRLNQKKNLNYELSDESSEIDEFIPREQFGKSKINDTQKDDIAFDVEEEEENFLREKQKHIGNESSKERTESQKRSLKRILRVSHLNPNVNKSLIEKFYNQIEKDEIEVSKFEESDKEYKQNVIKTIHDNDSELDEYDPQRLVTPIMKGSFIDQSQPSESTTATYGFQRQAHNKTRTSIINTQNLNLARELDQSYPTLHHRSATQQTNYELKDMMRGSLARKVLEYSNQQSYKQLPTVSSNQQNLAMPKKYQIPKKNIKFNQERELIYAKNRREFTENTDLIVKIINNKRDDKSQVQHLVKNNIFNSEIIDPNVKMQMIETIVSDKKPNFLKEAEQLAQQEKILLQKIMEADPKLLSENFESLDVEEIRRIYFTMLQDKYPRKQLQKLRYSLNKIYPSTKKVLSERKVRLTIEQEKHKMPLEKIEQLEKYLNLASEMNQYPSKNETKEEWAKKLMLKNEWEQKRNINDNQNRHQQLIIQRRKQAAKDKKLIQVISGANFKLSVNYGNQREYFSRSMNHMNLVKTDSKQTVTSIANKTSVQNDEQDIMLKIPHEQTSMPKLNVEQTAYRRWNKVFQRNKKLEKCRTSQVKVIRDNSRTLYQMAINQDNSELEIEPMNEESKLNKSGTIKKFKILTGIVGETMKQYRQFDL
ncbi:leucine rich repeat partial [Stylonychia lemnae]|uniref:Leucine rich repeat partial n=1 Tax=Stylonychia lemnae TaxID=5949 RepID=A0A078AS54_STYLE|nr:leucine rich repeat partial [Stylonychia lemnae]